MGAGHRKGDQVWNDQVNRMDNDRFVKRARDKRPKDELDYCESDGATVLSYVVGYKQENLLNENKEAKKTNF